MNTPTPEVVEELVAACVRKQILEDGSPADCALIFFGADSAEEHTPAARESWPDFVDRVLSIVQARQATGLAVLAVAPRGRITVNYSDRETRLTQTIDLEPPMMN